MRILEQIADKTHRVSPSRLKKIGGESPKAYLSDFQENTDSMRLGTIVESLLFEGKSDYSVVQDVNEHIINCSKYLAQHKLKAADVNILQWADSVGYLSHFKNKSLILKRMEDNGLYEYFEKITLGLPIISKELENKALELTAGLKANSEINEIVEAKGELQKFIEFEYNDVLCKGYIDKFIDRVYDLKIVEQPWKKSAKQFRWDMQLAFYNLPFNLPNPKVIVARAYLPDNPLLITLSDEDLEFATFGAEVSRKVNTRNHNYTIEGITQLLERYKFHSSTNQWDYSMEYYKSQKGLNLFI